MTPDETTVPTSTLLATVGALVTAIVALFRMVIVRHQEQADLSLRVGRLEGRHEGIEQLAQKTLDTVHNAIANKEKPDA